MNLAKNSISENIEDKLIKRIEIEEFNSLTSAEKIERIDRYLREIIENEKIIISEKKIFELVREIYQDSFGFGPISFLMNDDRISEIMINNFDQVYVEEDGIIRKTKVRFKDNSHVRNLVEKILSPLGLRVDESSPMVDARLQNGSRVNVVVKPISLADIVVTIRKFKKGVRAMGDLLEMGTLDEKLSFFMEACVKSRLNILISGGSASGKTTFLNVISNYILNEERIITIEDTLELNLNLPHVIRLESRPPNLEGSGEITIRDLVRNSLRMRPDRIIVGEMRGSEAVDVLQAMNTGHSGSMSTVHANSPKDLISRLETMLLMAGLNLNPPSARRMIASSIDMIVHLERLTNGRRIVARVSEVVDNSKSIDGNVVLDVRDIFVYKEKDSNSYTSGNDNESLDNDFYPGVGADNNSESVDINSPGTSDNAKGKVKVVTSGSFWFTGYIPTFAGRIRKHGFTFDFNNRVRKIFSLKDI